MSQFLKSSAPESEIPLEIVKVSDHRSHFLEVLGPDNYEIEQETECAADCVYRYVITNCLNNQEDRLQVIYDHIGSNANHGEKPETTK